MTRATDVLRKLREARTPAQMYGADKDEAGFNNWVSKLDAKYTTDGYEIEQEGTGKWSAWKSGTNKPIGLGTFDYGNGGEVI